MKKILKRTLAAVLCAALFAWTAAPAGAAVIEVKTQADRYAYVELFNKSVNRIKWDRPFGLLTYTNGVPKNGITVGDPLTGDELDTEVSRWLVPVLEGLFNNSSNLSQSFVKAIFGGKVNPETKVILTRGTLRNDSLPLYGRNEVSLLSADKTDYSVFAELGQNAARPEKIAILFPETALEDAPTASISDVFSLPDGTIDPVLVGAGGTGSKLPVDVKFSDFRFTNGRAAVQFNEAGDLTYYGTSVDYTFAFSLYDAMNIVTDVMGYNLYQTVINTINVVYANLGREPVDAVQILKQRSLYIVYRCAVEFSNISWDNRLFGDVNGDGSVQAEDARAALRHCVGLELLTNSADQIYTDVDFDGEITAADAREVLRMSVGLTPPMTEVPDGKTVRIALEEVEIPDEPPAEKDDDTPTGWFADIRVNTTPADVAQSVFDIVDAVRDLEEQIKDLADTVKDIAND